MSKKDFKPLEYCMFDEIGYICDECCNEGVAWEQSKPNRLLYEREVHSALMGLYACLGRKNTSTLTKTQVNIQYWFPVFFQDEEERGVE